MFALHAVTKWSKQEKVSEVELGKKKAVMQSHTVPVCIFCVARAGQLYRTANFSCMYLNNHKGFDGAKDAVTLPLESS